MGKQEDNIIDYGFKEIFRGGIKSFTIDNLASILRISKKTIYSLFPSKEILIDKIIKYKLSSIDKEIENILRDNKCPLEAFCKINNRQIKLISDIDINKVAELKIKYPDIWVYIERHRKNKRSVLSKIFKEAQKHGYLRDYLQPDEVAKLYSSIINRTFQPEFFIQEDVSMKDTIGLYVEIMSAGIFNDLALLKIKEYKKI
ncbi:MAG: hypothetical protein CMG11_04365 [Candidatus Marinimicrobia bacterium]|nr:hypothetical protein [Candidatus Neomarinimicrobiota bacterium]|tara:strand:- start:78 stop:680 length:603 start_codon:yes stop_codon:yes gene_type:complete